MATPRKPRKPRKPRPLSRLAHLRAALEQLEQMVLDAVTAESFTAAVAAKAKALQVRATIDELEQVQAARRRRGKTQSIEDYYDELIGTVRALRVGAMASGSHVAAVHALKLEGELLQAKGVAADRAAAALRAALSVADIEAEIARLRAARGA